MGNTRVIIPTKSTGFPDVESMQLNELRRDNGYFYIKTTDSNIQQMFETDLTPTNTATTSQTVDYTMTSADGTVQMTEADVTLPQASTCTDSIFRIENIGTTSIKVYCYGAETLNGSTENFIVSLENIVVKSDGSNFIVLSIDK